jgi:hypothetical protein
MQDFCKKNVLLFWNKFVPLQRNFKMKDYGNNAQKFNQRGSALFR